MEMSNDKTITETLEIEISVIFMGLGWQCESTDVEGVTGIGKTPEESIRDFVSKYEEKFDCILDDFKKELIEIKGQIAAGTNLPG